MSKDDFRDRLKSYSSEPEHGNWVKMQQLLDADKDDHKGIAWWKFGGLFALLLILISFMLFNGFFGEEEIKSHVDVNETSQSFSRHLDEEPISGQVNIDEQISEQTSASEEKEVEASEVKAVQVEHMIHSTSNSSNKAKKQKVSNQKYLKTNTQNSTQNNSIFSRPQANTPSHSKTSKISNINPNPILVKTPFLPTKNENIIVAISPLDHMHFTSFDLDSRVLPNLEVAPFTKVYEGEKHNPWYLVTGLGAKYPIVDISNAAVGSLIPTQKFFPSYSAEVGVGKHLGKMSVEAGAAASLYQYKLGRVFSEQEISAANSVGEFEESISSRAETTFIINKFAVLSPYLRLQYSIDLKKDFVLGLHGMVHFNRKIDLPNQVVSDQFADMAEASVEFDALTNLGILSNENTDAININYDLGFSIEKLFANRARVAMDFSYSFASGILEQGEYAVLRNSADETKGVYSISGVGPKVKFRYYLNTRG